MTKFELTEDEVILQQDVQGFATNYHLEAEKAILDLIDEVGRNYNKIQLAISPLMPESDIPSHVNSDIDMQGVSGELLSLLNQWKASIKSQIEETINKYIGKGQLKEAVYFCERLIQAIKMNQVLELYTQLFNDNRLEWEYTPPQNAAKAPNPSFIKQTIGFIISFFGGTPTTDTSKGNTTISSEQIRTIEHIVNKAIQKHVREMIFSLLQSYYREALKRLEELQRTINRILTKWEQFKYAYLNDKSNPLGFMTSTEPVVPFEVTLFYTPAYSVSARKFAAFANMNLDWSEIEEQDIRASLINYAKTQFQASKQTLEASLNGTGRQPEPSLIEAMKVLKEQDEPKLKDYFLEAVNISSPLWPYESAIIPTNGQASRSTYFGMHREFDQDFSLKELLPAEKSNYIPVYLQEQNELMLIQKASGAPLFALTGTETEQEWLRHYWEHSINLESHCWELPYKIPDLYPSSEDDNYRTLWFLVGRAQALGIVTLFRKIGTRGTVEPGKAPDKTVLDLYLKLCFPSISFSESLGKSVLELEQPQMGRSLGEGSGGYATPTPGAKMPPSSGESERTSSSSSDPPSRDYGLMLNSDNHASLIEDYLWKIDYVIEDDRVRTPLRRFYVTMLKVFEASMAMDADVPEYVKKGYDRYIKGKRRNQAN